MDTPIGLAAPPVSTGASFARARPNSTMMLPSMDGVVAQRLAAARRR
jgi:hypothetical protein